METTQFSGRIVKVSTEPFGDRIIERVYVRDGVSVIPIDEHHRIRCIREHDVVQRRTRTKLVSGWLEDGEEPLERAQRELEEEIGLRASEWFLYHTASMEGTVIKKQYYFIATGLHETAAHPEEGEAIVASVALRTDELYRLVRAGDFGSTETAYTLLQFVVAPLVRIRC